MMNICRYLFYASIIILTTSCSSVGTSYKQPEDAITVEVTKPSNLIISGDSAYYVTDSTFIDNLSSIDTLNNSKAEFVPFTEAPTVIKKVIPKCPVEALINSINGSSEVKVWIDKKGTPRRAILLQSTDRIFKDCSLIAAMQWEFTPAMMKKGPISVWIKIPFRFKCK